MAAFVGACAATSPRPKVPDTTAIRSYQLRNGMTVVLVPDPVATLVSVLVRYNVGAVDDPQHQEGVAHLAAHLMNDQRPGGTTLATQLERVAIHVAIEPRPMWTDFFARFTPDSLTAVMKLEATRLAMQCDRVDDATFEAERANLAVELTTHDSWRINRDVGEAIYPIGDPMRRAYAADAASVRSITKAQTCDFIDHRYAAGNATVVVTGPVSAAELEHAVTVLGDVPAKSFDPPATMPDMAGGAMRVEVAADVGEPTLAVAWPLPHDRTKRARAVVLLDEVARTMHAGSFGDGRYQVLWMPLAGFIAETKLADMAAALDNSVSALTERPVTRRTGRRPVRRQSDAFDDRSSRESFDRVRTTYLLHDLNALDHTLSRLTAIAGHEDFDTLIAAHAGLDAGNLGTTLDNELDVSRAKIIVLRPSGTRPITRAATLVEPLHELRRPLELDPASAEVQPHVPRSVLAQARELHLSNGLTAILAPTSAVPVVHVRLVFAGGGAAIAPRWKAANAAMAGLLSVLSQDQKGRLARLQWVTTWDSVALSLSAPSTLLENGLERFAGLRGATDKFADAAKRALLNMPQASTAAAATTDHEHVFLAHIYGTHPYGTTGAENAPGNAATLEDVVAFYSRFLQPDNATLIVTGSFDPDAAEKTIQRVFDSWRGHAVPPPIEKPVSQAASVITVPEPLPWVELRLGWQVGAGDAAHAVLAEMIDRLAPRTRCTWIAHRFGGHFEVRSVFERETASADIVSLRDAIASLGDSSAASRALFAVSRRAVAIKTAAGPLSSAEWLQALTRIPDLGHDLAWRQKLAERTAMVQYEDVRKLVADELSANAATWMLVGPEDAIAAAGSKLGLLSK